MTTALPFQAKQPIFAKMGGISELSHLSSEERRLYFKTLNKYRTNLSVMQNERAEGLEEGLEKGRAEGRAEEKRAIAMNLKKMAISPEQIAQITGLSAEEIANL